MAKIILKIMAMAVLLTLAAADNAAAHHVLGRPAYSLNEDSNTPPHMQAEAIVGDYRVIYMIYPAFPKPGEPGRISFYATHVKDGKPYLGKVTFKAHASTWLTWLGFEGDKDMIGTQPPDDNVYRQRYEFHNAGEYIITAEFEAGGEPHVLEFPLRIGAPPGIGLIGIVIGLLAMVILGVSVIQQRRAMTGKIRAARAQRDDPRRRSGSGGNGTGHAQEKNK